MLISDLFAAGGIVMWPLLAFSIISIALVVERLIFWLRINRRQKRAVREILSTYQLHPDTVRSKLRQYADLPIARIFLDALEMDHAPPQAFRLALESATQAELPILRRFSTVFDTIVAASPLFGLLGTITGLIRSFASLDLGSAGQGSAATVTGGISEALIATAAGLMIALFTLLFSNLFRGFYRRQITLIEEYGTQLELLHFCRHEGINRVVPSEPLNYHNQAVGGLHEST